MQTRIRRSPRSSGRGLRRFLVKAIAFVKRPDWVLFLQLLLITALVIGTYVGLMLLLIYFIYP
jgi:hypothetical protein